VVLCCFILKERDSFFSQISKNEMSAVVIYGWRTVGFADKEISEEEEGRRLDSSVDSYQRRRDGSRGGRGRWGGAMWSVTWGDVVVMWW
jgi:hypothetical protein